VVRFSGSFVRAGIKLNNGDRFSASENGPVEAALAEYFDRLDRGEEVDLPALVLAHPGCEDGLRRFLKHEHKLHEAVSAVSPAPPKSMVGRRLGDFELLRIVGRGGMGVVYEAEQLSLGRKVAVKLLPSGLCADPRHRTRFQNEARILAQLAHPHIVNVIAVGEEAETYYFAMQYVEGMTADRLIRRWTSEKPPHDAETARGQMTDDTEAESVFDSANGQVLTQFPPWVASYAERSERYRLCARIAAEVADGLAHAHACGVLHRDVKPSNILLDQNGTARLSDFGLARMYGDATLTATGAILGTLRYASPEQLGASHAAADERSDIYSLGVTLWELVTGRRLFKAENHNSVIGLVLNTEPPRPSSFAAKLPRDLETVIARAMSKEPRDRYPSAQAMADDLRRFLGGRPIQAKPVTLGERAFRWANRNRILATTAVASLVVLLVLAMLASGLVLRANSRTAVALIESRENERKTRELLYAADMALAGAAWRKYDVARVREILNRYAEPKTLVAGSTFEDLRGFEWYYLDRRAPPAPELLFQNNASLYLIDFMPDGHVFFTAGQDSIVRWHDADSGSVLHSLNTQQREINCVSYDRDGTRFATAGDDGTVKIWKASDRSLLRTIQADSGKCFVAKFVDRGRIITSGDTKSNQLFNVVTGQRIREYVLPKPVSPKVPPRAFSDIWVSNTGDRVWTCTRGGKDGCEGLFELDLATGKAREVCADPGIDHIRASRSEQFLLVTTNELTVRVLQASDGEDCWSTHITYVGHSTALSNNEKCLAVGDLNGYANLWNVNLERGSNSVEMESPVRIPVHNRRVYGAVFTPNDDALVTVGMDGSVRRTRVTTSIEPFREVTSLFASNSPIGTSTDRVLAIPNEPLRFDKAIPYGSIRKFSLSCYPPNATATQKTLVAAANSSHLGVMRVDTGEIIANVGIKGIKPKVRWMDFSPDQSLLAVTFNDGTDGQIELVDIQRGSLNSFLPPGSASLWSLFCVDDGLVAWLSKPEKLVCWNVRDKTVRWESTPSGPHCSEAAISPDRKLLVTAKLQDIALIDCSTGAVRYRTRCEYPVESLAFLANGRTFVVGGTEGQVSLWQTSSGQRLFEIGNIGSCVWGVYPVSNGALVSTGRLIDGKKKGFWFEF
jgi:serine/threonine protein kinase/WD40 repeat protein